MIDILLVDDSTDKIRIIMEIVNEFSEIPKGSVKICLDMNDARRSLTEKYYDLLLIDIQLPPHMGSTPIEDGGIGLLEDIKSLPGMKRPNHVIGITSYSDTRIMYEKNFSNELLTIIECNPGVDLWREQLRNKISYLIKLKAQERSKTVEFDYDVAIITAVEQERTAINDLAADWMPLRLDGDPTTYQCGIFESGNKRLKVVTAMQPQMGMQAAAVLSMKLIYNFRPKYLIMAGIAAGNAKEDVKIGDILVAEQSWDYGSGKIRSNPPASGEGKRIHSQFLPAPSYLLMDVELSELFRDDFSDFMYEIHKKCKYPKPEWLPRIRLGPVASGAAVIQNASIVETYVDSHNRKLIGLDMETYGVFYAARNAAVPRPRVLSMKSVCDFGDASKNNLYQAYAAYTSANFTYFFTLNKLDFS